MPKLVPGNFIDLAAFEAQLEANLERLHRELKEGTYQPQPVLQRLIPKAGQQSGAGFKPLQAAVLKSDGGERLLEADPSPLDAPTIRTPGQGKPEAPSRPQVVGLVLVGFAVIAVFFGVLGGWAALARLDSAAIAPGVVVVDTKRKTVQHLEGGIVGEILVRDGDRVHAGQVLIRLDETRPRATLELLRGRYMAAQALEARLIAERDHREEIILPESLLGQRDDPKVAEIIDGQTNIFVTRQQTLSGQIGILRQRMAQYREEIRGIEGEIAAEGTQLRLIAEEIATVSKLLEKGLAKKPRLLALQRQQAEINGERSRNEASIARAKNSIAETRLRITELETARIDEVVQELRDTQTQQFDLVEKMRAAEDVLRRTAILAPLGGVVVDLKVHTHGGVIAPGEPLLDVVPSADRLVVEAQIDPDDIDVAHEGLTARVQFTAFNRRHLVPVKGVVTSVSADRLVDERSGLPYYLARIELADDLPEALNGTSLYPGMQAEVMIVTEKRTVLDMLVQPIAQSFNRAFREE